MSVALPYTIDVSGPGTTVLKGVAGLLIVVVVGVLYSLLVSHNLAAVTVLLIAGVVAIYFGRLFLTNLPGTTGTITASAVTVERERLFGMPLAGPEGTFPIRQFKAVRVEMAPPLAQVLGQHHERVSLVGKDGVPTILVAETSRGAGRTLGRDLSAALSLPVDEQLVPY